MTTTKRVLTLPEVADDLRNKFDPHSPLSWRISRVVGDHHDNSFGEKPLVDRALKLAEETGEVAAAVVRHTEARDGRDWRDEIGDEIGDVIVVLHAIADALGLDLDRIARHSIANFLEREWQIGSKSEMRED